MPILNTELSIDPRQEFRHGLLADPEDGGDFWIRLALRELSQHFGFARGQAKRNQSVHRQVKQALALFK